MSERNYNCKDVDMLLACKTISESLKANIAELSLARTTWNIDYVGGLSTKIDNAMDQYLGMDKKKELREATARLSAIQAPALRDLSFLKTQLEVDFGSKATELLKQLGFTKNIAKVKQGNQEALIELLHTFKSNMNEGVKANITEKGTNPVLIDRIIGYANQMVEANVSQETMKETTKALSAEAVNALNDIYTETIGICKIAANFFQYEPIKKEQFTFSKVVSQMGVSKKASQPAEE